MFTFIHYIVKFFATQYFFSFNKTEQDSNNQMRCFFNFFFFYHNGKDGCSEGVKRKKKGLPVSEF